MDIPNAFVGRRDKPSSQEVIAALGPSAAPWNELLTWMTEHKVDVQEWKSYSPKYGWSLQVKLKKRTIVHLSPCVGSFRAAIILGDRAVAAAKNGKLPKSVMDLIDAAPRYPEGTGVRFEIKNSRQLSAVRKIAEIKLAN